MNIIARDISKKASYFASEDLFPNTVLQLWNLDGELCSHGMTAKSLSTRIQKTVREHIEMSKAAFRRKPTHCLYLFPSNHISCSIIHNAIPIRAMKCSFMTRCEKGKKNLDCFFFRSFRWNEIKYPRECVDFFSTYFTLRFLSHFYQTFTWHNIIK